MTTDVLLALLARLRVRVLHVGVRLKRHSWQAVPWLEHARLDGLAAHLELRVNVRYALQYKSSQGHTIKK